MSESWEFRPLWGSRWRPFAVVNTFINFNAGLTDFSKSEVYLPLLAGAVIWLVAMFAYRHLLEAIPRAGGEYVFLSRSVSLVAGSMAGIGIAVVFTYVLSANAHFAATFTPFMLTVLGSAFNSTSIGSAANDVTSNLAVVLISCGVMVVVAVASLFSLKRPAQITCDQHRVLVVVWVGVWALLRHTAGPAFHAGAGQSRELRAVIDKSLSIRRLPLSRCRGG